MTLSQIPERDIDIWQTYWEARKNRLSVKGGKISAVTAAWEIVEKFSRTSMERTIIELGCGEGHLLNMLSSVERSHHYIGVDYSLNAIQRGGSIYPHIKFVNRDYTNSYSLTTKQADLILLVNSLHEVYSTRLLQSGSESEAKSLTTHTLDTTVSIIKQGGYLILFDGVEHLEAAKNIEIEFHSDESLKRFLQFAREYHPYKITYQSHSSNRRRVTLSVRDFTRYITKLIFISTPLWPIEARESYQYLNQIEFGNYLINLGMQVEKVQLTSPSKPIWCREVSILSKDIYFPDEHILIIARKL